MREFGWTEKQLLEEVTIGTLNRIAFVMSEEGKKMKRESAGGKSASRIKR